MHIESSFEADAQLGEACKPSMRALNNPSMPAQSLLAFNTDTGDAGGDATALQIAPASTAVVPLVGMELVGPLARTSIQPANRRDGVQVDSNAIESCRFALVTVMASGIPWASTTRCRLLPSSPRSVGFGPVSWPPGGWTRLPRRCWPAANRFGHARAGGQASPHAACPIPRRLASRAAVASKSCRCQNQAPGASPPKGYRSAARTGCRSMPLCRRPSGGVRLWPTARIPVSTIQAPPTIPC
ncbi:hypothetical protein ACEQUB_00816 [Ralstonia syzygii]